MEAQLLEILRCPLCGERLQDDGSQLACSGCLRTFERDGDVPLLFHDDLPGAREKKREMDGWVEKARSEGWYEPDDDLDRTLPWPDRERAGDEWLANTHSFSIFLTHQLAILALVPAGIGYGYRTLAGLAVALPLGVLLALVLERMDDPLSTTGNHLTREVNAAFCDAITGQNGQQKIDQVRLLLIAEAGRRVYEEQVASPLQVGPRQVRIGVVIGHHDCPQVAVQQGPE